MLFVNVPLSKIKIVSAELNFIPGTSDLRSSETGGPPVLVKHSDGFYHVYNGTNRIYGIFNKYICKYHYYSTPNSVSEETNQIKWAHEIVIPCEVEDQVDPEPSYGKFIWQINTRAFRKIRTTWWKKVAYYVAGYSSFRLLQGKVHGKLSWKTKWLLTKIDHHLQTLYSDGLYRLHELMAVAEIEKYVPSEQREDLKKEQLKRLKRYEESIRELIAKDVVGEK